MIPETHQPAAAYAKAPLPPDESARLETLRRYQILDTPPDAELDDLAQIAAALCGTPIALISLVDEHRQWFKARVGLDAAQTGRAESFCAHAVAAADLLLVPDARSDPRFADNPLVEGEPYIRFYCGVPLRSPEGHAIGTVCAIDRAPRSLTEAQVRGLEAIARQVMQCLNRRRAALEEQARLRMIAVEGNLGTWEWDLAADRVTYSETVGPLFGLPAGASPPHYDDFLRAVHPDDRERLAAEVAQAVATDRSGCWEYRVTWPDGSVHWLKDVVRILHDERGRAQRMLGLTMDITPRKQAEEAARAGEERLAQAVRAAALGFFDHDQRTDQLFWSRRMYEILGIPAEAEASLSRYLAVIHPDDRDRVRSAVARAHDPTGDGLFTAEHRLLRPDGSTRWVSLRSRTEFEGQGAARRPVRTIGAVADITDFKRAETVIRESEARLRLSLEASGAGCWSWDVSTNRPNWDARYHQMYGFGPDDPVSFEAWIARVHADDRPRLLARIQALMAPNSGEAWNEEFRAVFPNGQERWMAGMGRIERDAEGLAVRFVGINLDITERKQAEAAVRISEERYALAVRGTNDGIWDWNILTDEDYLSPRWKALLGYEDHELPNRPESFFARLHPEDVERVQAAVQAHLNEGAPYNLELRLRHKDGGYRWFQSRGEALRDDTGRPLRMAGSITDITARKEADAALRASEERFTLAIRGTRDGIWDWNVLTNEAYHSPRWKELLGYADHELSNQAEAFFSRLHPDDFARVQAAGADAIERGLPVEFECRLRHRDETYRWFLSRGAPVLDGKGRTVRMTGAISDITEQKRAAAEILGLYQEGQRTARRLQELSRRLLEVQEGERKRLARDLHDEMGQSLSALKLALNKLRRGTPEARQDRLLGDCQAITSQMLEEVRRLTRELRPPVLDDLGLAAALEWQAEQQASRCGWALTCRVEPGLPRYAPDLEITCFRILQEALTNIARHAQARTVRVSLRAADGLLRLAVADDGVGFDADAAGHPRQGVASYGLLGMRERAELIDGRLRLSSQPGRGTEVEACFPIGDPLAVPTLASEGVSR